MATQTLLRFLIQRTVSAVLLIWLAASGMLGLMRLSAGDFVRAEAAPGASQEVIAQRTCAAGTRSIVRTVLLRVARARGATGFRDFLSIQPARHLAGDRAGGQYGAARDDGARARDDRRAAARRDCRRRPRTRRRAHRSRRIARRLIASAAAHIARLCVDRRTHRVVPYRRHQQRRCGGPLVHRARARSRVASRVAGAGARVAAGGDIRAIAGGCRVGRARGAIHSRRAVARHSRVTRDLA